MSCGHGLHQPDYQDYQDDNWEIVQHGEAQHQDTRNADDPFFSIHWGDKVLLQIGGRADVQRREGSQEPRLGTVSPHYDAQAQCILFRLPLELRQRIYEEYFSIKSPKVHLKWYPTSRRGFFPVSVLMLLEVCRRIHAEAEHIFYSANKLEYSILSPTPTTDFFKILSPTRLESIQDLTISVSSAGETLYICQRLLPLQKLRALTIERQQCVRYIDIQAWILLSKQLTTELEKLEGLTVLEVVTPDTPKPTPEDEQRMQRLDQVDDLLREVIAKCNKEQAVETQHYSSMAD